jgi:hypothetical protein
MGAPLCFTCVRNSGDPGSSGGGRSPDPQGRIDGFKGARGQVVELEVGLLVGAFPEAGEVGLVPHLKVPGAHFVPSVTLLDVADVGGDEILPSLRLGMGGITVPVENTVL